MTRKSHKKLGYKMKLFLNLFSFFIAKLSRSIHNKNLIGKTTLDKHSIKIYNLIYGIV